jgi:hypothetical protein
MKAIKILNTKVLDLNPDYPKIDKEVLSKARTAIKNPTV